MNNPTEPLNTADQLAPITYDLPKAYYAYRTADCVAAWLAWLMGYLFCVVTPVSGHLWGAFAFVLLLFVGGLLYFRRAGDKRRISPRAWIIAAVSCLLAVSFLFSTNRVILACVFVLTCMAWFYMIFVLGGNSLETLPNRYFLKEWCKAILVMPFRAKGHLFGAMTSKCKKGERDRRIGIHILWILVGLLVALIPTLVVTLLLSYDAGFTQLLHRISRSLTSLTGLPEQIGNIILGLLVALLIFGALLACRDRRGLPNQADDREAITAHICPVTLICAALTPILILYVIFFISQWDYYVSAILGIRPEELTYADYAREGFFQLCAVAGINAGLAILATALIRHRPADPQKPKRDPVPPALRVYMIILSVFTLVLIATALAKMLLYVDSYGLTPKRVYTTWFMLLLAASFIAVIIRQIWRRMNLMATLLAVFLLFFGALSLVNTDAMIAQYNVDAYLNGNLNAMEGDVLDTVGVSGVLPALEFMERTGHLAPEADPDLTAIRVSTEAYLYRQSHNLENASWSELNITSLRARAALRRAGYDESTSGLYQESPKKEITICAAP